MTLRAAPILLNPLPAKNRGLYRVPQQQKWVLERYGAFWGVLDAGPHFVTPLIDEVKFAVTTSEVAVPMVVRDCMTQDGLLVDLEIDVIVRISEGVNDIKRLCYGSVDTPSLFVSLASGRVAQAAKLYTFEELSGAPFKADVMRALCSPLNPSQLAEADPSLWDVVPPKATEAPTPTPATPTPPATPESTPEASKPEEPATPVTESKSESKESGAQSEAAPAKEKEAAPAKEKEAEHKEEGSGSAFITAQTGLVAVGFQMRHMQLTPEARYQLSIRAHEQHVRDATRVQIEQESAWREAAAKQQEQSDVQRGAVLSRKMEEDNAVQIAWAKTTAEAIRVLSSAIRAERELDGIKSPAVDSAQLAVQLLVNSK